jgi:hypothetical protein
MPAAALGAGLGAVGSVGSAAGGKKAAKRANDLAQSQLRMQQGQFKFAKGQTNAGNQSLAPATGYFNDLLKGGQAAVQATGPYASLIGQAAQGTQKAIQASTPRGGEQNLALAQNRNDQFNQIARLYAGMQPLAAQGLQQSAGLQYGSAAPYVPSANTSGAFGNYANQQSMAAQQGQGFGNLLFNSVNKLKGGQNAGKETGTGTGGA